MALHHLALLFFQAAGLAPEHGGVKGEHGQGEGAEQGGEPEHEEEGAGDQHEVEEEALHQQQAGAVDAQTVVDAGGDVAGAAGVEKGFGQAEEVEEEIAGHRQAEAFVGGDEEAVA